MTVYIEIYDSHYFGNNMPKTKIDWKFPNLFQIGEDISVLSFIKHIDKHLFFDTLDGKGKYEIINKVKNYMYNDDLDKETAENRVFEEWVTMYTPCMFRLNSITWGLDENDDVSITLSIQLPN